MIEMKNKIIKNENTVEVKLYKKALEQKRTELVERCLEEGLNKICDFDDNIINDVNYSYILKSDDVIVTFYKENGSSIVFDDVVKSIFSVYEEQK